MRRIYRKATYTIAWLGEGGNDSHVLFQAFDQVSRVLHTHEEIDNPYLQGAPVAVRRKFDDMGASGLRSLYRQHSGLEINLFAWFEMLEENEDHILYTYEQVEAYFEVYQDLKDVEKTITEQLEAMFSHSYWTRKWIIQEVAVAPNLVLWCGQEETDWDDFTKPLIRLFELVQKNHNPASYRGLENCAVKHDIRNHIRSGKAAHLINLTKLTVSFDSKDPLDRIFPLLGLAFDAELHVPLPYYDRAASKKAQKVGQAAPDLLSKLQLDMSIDRIRSTQNLDISVSRVMSQNSNSRHGLRIGQPHIRTKRAS